MKTAPLRVCVGIAATAVGLIAVLLSLRHETRRTNGRDGQRAAAVTSSAGLSPHVSKGDVPFLSGDTRLHGDRTDTQHQTGGDVQNVPDGGVAEDAKALTGRDASLNVMHGGDQPLVDASQAALAKEGDDRWANEIAATSNSEPDSDAPAQMADVLRHVRSPSAGSNLLALSANLDEGEKGADDLRCAAVEAMGNVGTTQLVASLVQQLGQATSAMSIPAYDAMLGALSRVDNPESRPLLVSMVKSGLAGELGGDLYWAAVRALRFHPDATTRSLLEHVTQSDDKRICSVAQNSLRVMARLARP